MDKQIELKPCPFCGGNATVQAEHKSLPFSEEENFYYVCCTNCGCRPFVVSEICLYYKSDYEIRRKNLIEKVIEKWNRRVNNG